ncbi:MAG TPA: outer membrane beta-barrel protein [Blastocatellia bacterium]|nr:outer membrane beta-barrel protein [Blastocatellia bacterium]
MSKKSFLFASLNFITGLLLIAVPSPAAAQGSDVSGVAFSAGAGFVRVRGESDARLDNGWSVTAGAGYRFNQYLGVMGEYSYSGLGVADRALGTLRVPTGKASVLSLTANPTVHFGARSPVGAYLIGGGGLYRRRVNFDQPTTGPVVITDPWWGYNGPAAVPANTVIGAVSSWAAGWNLGGGVTFKLSGTRTRLFVEYRYHRAYTRNSQTVITPMTVGVRW